MSPTRGRRPALTLPGAAVPLLLRATRANRTFATAEGAHRRIREASLRPDPYGPPRRLRPDVRVDVVHDRAWPVYRITPLDGAPEGGLVYVHGGGWVNEIAPQHWHLAADLAVGAGVVVTVPIYPLVPFGTAGPTRDRVVELVRGHLAEGGPALLAGDSAGGQVALSAALHLRDEGVRLPLTALVSPALDLSWSNPRIPVVQPTDPWLATPGGRVLAEAWRGDLPLADPAVSPLSGAFEGLGPLLVFSGTRDVLNPDAHLLVQRARAEGVRVTFHEGRGQVHVPPLLPTRAGREAAARLVEGVRRAAAPLQRSR